MGTTDARRQMERFRQHLARKGLKLTAQRKAIAEVFFADERHLSLLELLERAQGLRGGIGYATVYRTMRLLTEGGLATEHKFGENQARYEPADDGDHHDHLICVDCGAIVEFEEPAIEAMQERIALEHGFEVVSHRHEIYVRCRSGSCRKGAVG
jgi:Fur family ferric uptake transcriptional regulator